MADSFYLDVFCINSGRIVLFLICYNYQNKLYRRINQEFIRIAKENPGKTIGVSMHGASMSTLLEALNKSPRGVYLPPHYNSLEVKVGNQVILPISLSVANCALFYFRFDSRTDQLELINPLDGF